MKKHPRWLWPAIWSAWGGVGLAIEVYTLQVEKQKEDTLSAQLWQLVKRPWAWWMTAGALVWFTIHVLGKGKLG